MIFDLKQNSEIKYSAKMQQNKSWLKKKTICLQEMKFTFSEIGKIVWQDLKEGFVTLYSD